MEKVRYLNKRFNRNERENYSRWWKEQIEQYGTSVTYYTHGYTLTSHNFLYGEDVTAPYQKSDNLILLTDITNDSLMLSKFGIMADCDMTAVVHISSFYEQFGCGAEPKAGDLIQLTEYGADRPGGRAAPIYEITERDDEYLPMTNPLLGHYVWYIKCKRFEYSYEPGIEVGRNPSSPPEDEEPFDAEDASSPDKYEDGVGPNDKQPSDGGAYGVMPEGSIPEDLFQPYPDSVQNSAKCIYDYYDQRNAGLDRNLAHYVPPQLPDCDVTDITSFANVPGPYAKKVTFTEEDKKALENLAYLAQHLKDVAVRKPLSADEGTKTFSITTSAEPTKTLQYTGPDDEAYILTDLLAPSLSS